MEFHRNWAEIEIWIFYQTGTEIQYRNKSKQQWFPDCVQTTKTSEGGGLLQSNVYFT